MERHEPNVIAIDPGFTAWGWAVESAAGDPPVGRIDGLWQSECQQGGG